MERNFLYDLLAVRKMLNRRFEDLHLGLSQASLGYLNEPTLEFIRNNKVYFTNDQLMAAGLA